MEKRWSVHEAGHHWICVHLLESSSLNKNGKPHLIDHTVKHWMECFYRNEMGNDSGPQYDDANMPGGLWAMNSCSPACLEARVWSPETNRRKCCRTERLSRASWRHSWCSWPAPPAGTTGRSPCWHSPQSRCRGWCSWGRKTVSPPQGQTRTRDAHALGTWRETLTCWRRCRSPLWWSRVWNRRGWSPPASPCPSSQHLYPPTPGTRTEVRRRSVVPQNHPPLTSSYHGDHWTGAHVVDEGGKEGPVLQVNVMLHEEVLGRLRSKPERHERHNRSV